jgi:hypothetical protein
MLFAGERREGGEIVNPGIYVDMGHLDDDDSNATGLFESLLRLQVLHLHPHVHMPIASKNMCRCLSLMIIAAYLLVAGAEEDRGELCMRSMVCTVRNYCVTHTISCVSPTHIYAYTDTQT